MQDLNSCMYFSFMFYKSILCLSVTEVFEWKYFAQVIKANVFL